LLLCFNDSEAETQQTILSKREEQLRRDKTRLHTKMLQAEHEMEALRAETEHLRKQAKDATQLAQTKDQSLKQLQETLDQERTQHMAKVSVKHRHFA
jgi:DNA anti-recombination protein RmuC